MARFRGGVEPVTPKAALGMILSIVLFDAVLFHIYRTTIAPEFSYQGLRFREPAAWVLGISIASATVTAFALPRSLRQVSDFVVWMVFGVVGLPAILLVPYADILDVRSSALFILNVSGAFVLCRVLVALAPRRLIIPRGQGGGLNSGFAAAALFTILIIGFLVINGNVQFSFLTFDEVYDTRTNYVKAVQAAGLLGYAVPLQANVVNPLLMIAGITQGRVGLLGLGVAGQVILYLATGQKSFLGVLVAVPVISLLMNREIPSWKFVGGMSLWVGWWTAVDAVLSGGMALSIFVRRAVVVPSLTGAAYVSVFEDLPKTNFADSLLPFLVDPYMDGLSPVLLVGKLFVGDAGTAANASFIGHGFLSLGYVGIYIEAAFLALALRLANDATSGLPLRIACALFFMPTVALASSSVFTAMVTHGFMAAIVVAALWPRPMESPLNRPRVSVAPMLAVPRRPGRLSGPVRPVRV